ncbi:MAG: PD40 domain-containing protein [Bacteroidales bacterium]|nr:PD40 domain-containing protein [Bacteroidales bacterium]
MNRILISLFLILIMNVDLLSQNLKKDQETFLEAEYFLMFEDYTDALFYYLDLYETYPENYNLAYRIGICYLGIPGSKHLAIEYLEEATKNSEASYREGSLRQTTAPYTAWYFLGNAYRINYQFEKAKEAYKKYRETLLEDDTDNILFIDHQINVCDDAKSIMDNPVKFEEENIGERFNDENNNFNPIISSDGLRFAYMSSLKFYDAVFFSTKEKNRWTDPVNIIPDLKSDGDLYISCLADNGNTLYLSQDNNIESDIYYSKYDGEKWSPAKPLSGNINTSYWESHAFVTEDGSALIFSSNRPGGMGGLDLYISYKNGVGEWGEPVNLGPVINTPFNEDRAFLINNAKQLFFCSQGHYNMGGFDLFRSEKLDNNNWSKPENLGYPINSSDDDVFFMPVNSGRSGYISVHREGKGFGKDDIYLIKFK